MYSINEIVERLGLIGEREASLHVTLLRELALGQPVTIERLAKSLNWTTDKVLLVLEKLPCGTIEYDDQRRLIGSGITLRETPHAFVINDRPLYTCALDALMFPTVIGERAQVQSRCPQTNNPINMTITPQRVVSLEPEDAVVSLVSVAASGDIRSAFCCDVLFFASRQAGEAWGRDKPSAQLVTVQEGFELGQRIAHLMLDRARRYQHDL
jgi:alkylmercury lyase